jgi:hypothetical protein
MAEEALTCIKKSMLRLNTFEGFQVNDYHAQVLNTS